MTAWLTLFALVSLPSGAQEECHRAFPRLKPVIEAVSRVTEASVALGFDELLEEGKRALGTAQRHADAIHEVGCALPEDKVEKLDRCLKWIQWSCEPVAFGLFLDFLDGTPKTTEQSLAYRHFRIEAVTPHETRPLEHGLFTDRAYFSCGGAEGTSLSQPLLTESETGLTLARLASRDGKYGKRALELLARAVESVEASPCSCERVMPRDRKAIRATLRLVGRSRLEGPNASQVKALFARLDSVSRRPPKRLCPLPEAPPEEGADHAGL